MTSKKKDPVICRGCMKQCTDYTSIFRRKLIQLELTTLATIVNYCTELNFCMDEDFMPGNMCKTCCKTLVKLYDFKKMITRSDKALRKQHNKRDQVQETELLNACEVIEMSSEEQESDYQHMADNKLEIGLKVEEEDYDCLTFEEVKLQEPVYYSDEVAELPEKIKLERKTTRKSAKSSSEAKPNKPELQCSICSEKFRIPYSLRVHMKQHLSSKTCQICSKVCRSASSLHTHMAVHTGEKPFHCEICGKGITQRSGYKKHMLTHTGEMPFCCEICGREFRFSSGLIIHRRIHTGERPYGCKLCEKSFRTSEKLSRHSLVHTGIKPYACELCGKHFKQRTYLAIHRMKMHADINAKTQKVIKTENKICENL